MKTNLTIDEQGTISTYLIEKYPNVIGALQSRKNEYHYPPEYEDEVTAKLTEIRDPSYTGVTKDDLFEAAASKRWQVETSGIVLAGLPVQTDDRAKTLIAGAAGSNEPDTAMLKLKVGHGTAWVDVNFGQIRAMQDAITAHVQACFATEAAVAAEIDAGTITDIAGIDAASWPSNTG